MRGGEVTHVEEDPRTMFIELSNLRDAPHTPDAQSNDENGIELRRMLGELQRSASPLRLTTAADEDNDPRQMLADLATLSAPGPRDSIAHSSDHNDEDDEIDILRIRIEHMRALLGEDTPQMTPDREPGLTMDQDTHDEIAEGPTTDLDTEIIPYAVALQLECSKIQWEHAKGWTTYLYSPILDGHEAQQRKEAAVAHAEDALKRIIDSVLEVEEDTKPQRRLIVSNLAADADEEALWNLLNRYWLQM
jgi:hypothetical protein